MTRLDVETFVGIEIKGPDDGVRDLNFFIKKNKKEEWEKPSQTSIVYGRNGAGKSTIGQSFLNASEDLKTKHFTDGQIVTRASQGEFDNVHVFNDQYIADNLHIEASELGSIVLLGDQVDLQVEIDKTRELLDASTEKLGKWKGLEEETKKQSERANDEVRKKLKIPDGWAARQSRIEGLKQNKKVGDEVVAQICKEFNWKSDEVSLQDLNEKFKAALDGYLKASGDGKESWSRPVVEVPFNLNEVKQLLATYDTPPTSASNSLLTMRLMKSDKSIQDLQSLIKLMQKHDVDYCSTCAQDLSVTYKEDIVVAALELLEDLSGSDVATQARMTKRESETLLSTPQIVKIPTDLRERLEKTIDLLNEEVEKVNSLLNQKADTPNRVIDFSSDDLENLVFQVNAGYAEIEHLVEKYNHSVNALVKIREDLDSSNLQMAAVEVYPFLFESVKKYSHFAEAEKQVKRYKRLEDRYLEELRQLQVKQRNEVHAVHKINYFLSIILGEGRLELRAEESGYSSWSAGRSVLPKRLSTGEKNILGLCYFFIDAARGERFEDSLGSEQLLILDDPISSFDIDNKYGVMAFLVHIAKQHIYPGTKTKILLLSHDISAAYDLSKAFSGLTNAPGIEAEYEDGAVVSRKFDQVDVYKGLIGKMYKVAYGGTEVSEISSNDVRRVYEAFIRFELDDNPTDAASRRLVREFFKGLGTHHEEFLDRYLARIFIHPGSHSASNVLAFDYYLRPGLTGGGARRFIRETLCFIHLLSPLHIAANIGVKDNEKIAIQQEMDDNVAELLKVSNLALS